MSERGVSSDKCVQPLELTAGTGVFFILNLTKPNTIPPLTTQQEGWRGPLQGFYICRAGSRISVQGFHFIWVRSSIYQRCRSPHCMPLTPMLLVANLANTKWCEKALKITETLTNGYSSESTQRALSNEYQHNRFWMVFKDFYVFVLWTKVVSALEGLRKIIEKWQLFIV